MIANIVFWGWPILGIILFLRLSLPVAILWTTVGGYLVLPRHIEIDLPALPAINFGTISVGTALICAWFTLAQRTGKAAGEGGQASVPGVLPGWLPQTKIINILLAAMMVGAIMTVLTNMDTVVEGGKVLPGLGIYDVLSAIQITLVSIVPMIMGRKFFAYEDTHKTLLLGLCIAGLIYSLPTLYEVRMSPQLYRMVYGGNIMSWVQSLRGGGFRPTVFLGHGLTLGIFMAVTVLAALGYMRTALAPSKPIYFVAFLWLFVTLVFIKAFGALIIVIVLFPVILFGSVRIQLLVAGSIALIILTYPILRGAGLVPTDEIVRYAAKVDVTRSYSVEFRFINEDALLEKAEKRPLFGWGGWGRSRLYDERGVDVSTPDGLWAILIGVGGWVKYLATFGLLTATLLIFTFKKKSFEVNIATSALCVILVANLIDLIPNAGLSVVTWIIAGALAGRLEVGRENAQDPVEPETVNTRPYPYARRHPTRQSPRHSTAWKETS